MTSAAQVEAFHHAGRVDGSLASVYLFNTLHATDVIRSGDRVVDLGCGSGVQLRQIAQVNPGAQFIGVDLSAAMLETARRSMQGAGVQNVDLVADDMSTLATIPTGSVDAVISSVALHHLPDVEALDRTFASIARVLRADGGLYILDFGMLESDLAIEYFVARSAPFVEEKTFLEDYAASLRAGFSSSTFRDIARRHLGDRCRVRRTFGVDFMVAIKSASRCDAGVCERARTASTRLTAAQRRDFCELRRFMRLGGLRTPNPFS
jgi:ubiquinone/menaquinone biosynthesis C-methylase UbiE